MAHGRLQSLLSAPAAFDNAIHQIACFALSQARKSCAAPRFFQSNSPPRFGVRGERLMMKSLTPEAIAVIEGRHANPFRFLGPHTANGRAVLRVFVPDALAGFRNLGRWS